MTAPIRPHPVFGEHYASVAERPDYTRLLFDATACHYDRIDRLFSFGSGVWYRRHALRRGGLSPGMRMLDVAVGTGLVARAALQIIGDQSAVVGLDVSLNTLLRRLGPKRFRGRPTPERVIDWDAVAPFSGDLTSSPPAVQLRSSDEQLRRMAPADLADLLEDLGRPARQDLLSRLENDTAADALEEMDPDELEALLREVRPEQAAGLLAAMEPDEAVDALRDLSDAERHAKPLTYRFLLLSQGAADSPW